MQFSISWNVRGQDLVALGGGGGIPFAETDWISGLFDSARFYFRLHSFLFNDLDIGGQDRCLPDFLGSRAGVPVLHVRDRGVRGGWPSQPCGGRVSALWVELGGRKTSICHMYFVYLPMVLWFVLVLLLA